MNDRRLKKILRFIKTKPLGALSAFVILLLVIAAVLAPFVSPFDPDAQDPNRVMTSPSLSNLFGTDQVGRDLLSRIIYGARITLLVGLLSVALGVIIGVSLGLVTGYCGGKVDLIAQGAVDCVMAFPAIVLALALVAVLGTSLSNVIVAIGIVISPRVARVVRGSVLSVKEEEYIMASKASGCSHSRILFLHILPNVMASIIVMATINLGQAILVEPALSFIE